MVNPRTLRCGAGLICLTAAAYARSPVPIADPVERTLLPSGISEAGIELNGELAFLFKDEDGTSAVHVLGGFSLRQGHGEAQRLSSREAVVWITPRQHEGRPYRHLEILLWRDADIAEVGGTHTNGPALFVTLNTFGAITTNVDDLAFQSSADRDVYREGNAIRKALSAAKVFEEDTDAALRVLDTSGLGGEEGKPKVRPTMTFQSPGELTMLQRGDRQVMTVVGGAYLSRGAPEMSDFLEIRADSVVVFLPASASASATAGGSETDEPASAGLGSEPGAERRRPRRASSQRQMLSGGFGEAEIEAVYLEGDVVMSQGPVSVRASRLFYDFADERALILDAVVHMTLAARGIPLYVRAEQIRQLSTNRFVADKAILTTSEFHTPHYHIGARSVELSNRTPLEPTGKQGAVRSGNFRIRDATLNLFGTPIAWWPYMRGSIETSETAIQSIRTGFSNDFGLELESNWDLFNVLGLEKPEGFGSTLSLDYYTRRGPGVGIDIDYKRDTYFGLHRSYVLSDDGKDRLGRKREPLNTSDIRGRVLARHRQYLDDDWELTFELSYISEKGFLEEFYEFEFDNEKEQETLLYLKKQRDNWALTATLQTRILDFYTQTERFPDLSFYLLGEPVGGRATWFSENRAGVIRYRTATQTFREFLRDGYQRGSGAVLRADTRQEVGAPIDVGPLRVVPFAMVRGTAWDDSYYQGGLARGLATVGMRGSMYLWRVFPDIRSELFDVEGVRHIIKPDVTAWVAESNVRSDHVFPFDGTVEEIDEIDGLTFGLRQRWQTKRGEGQTRRTVDFLTLDVELGVFNDTSGRAKTGGFASFSRPENSIARNYVNTSLIWRTNDRTALLAEMNYDMNDGEVDIFNMSFVVERSPRLSYLFAYRYIGETKSNLLGFDLNYRLTEKHTVAFRELFDLQSGRTLDFTVAFIRKFPRWFGALAFQLDDAEDDFGISFSIWPEGLPQAALGSKRFTGLARSTTIQNN